MQKPLRFLAVGGLATALQYLILVLAVELLGWRPDLASGLGYGVSAVANYALNYRLTFRSTAAHRRAFLRFTIMVVVGVLASSALMSLLAIRLEIPYILAQLVTTTVITIGNYLVSDRWVYRD